MPHLIYAGRFWKVAGDEFALPALCSSIFRLFWCITMSIFTAFSFSRLTNCTDGWVILLYLFLSIVVFALSICAEICIFKISLRGTIVQSFIRSDMGKYLTLHSFLGICQLLCAIFGITIIEFERFPCADDLFSSANKIVLSVVVISQLIDVLSLLCCCYLFSHQTTDKALAGSTNFDEGVELWEKRCKFLCKFVYTSPILHFRYIPNACNNPLPFLP